MIEFILLSEDFKLTYDRMGISIELIQAIGVGDLKTVEAVLKSEKIHINPSVLDFTSDEKIKILLRKKLKLMNPTQEEEESESETSEEEESEEEESEPKTPPEGMQRPQSNPLPDQAAIPTRPVRDDCLSRMDVSLERQVTEWRALNSLFNNHKRRFRFPLLVNIHTTSAVKPKEYVKAVLDELPYLLEDVEDAEVVLITGRGRHSKQRGHSRLQKAVYEIANEENFRVIATTDPGRLSLNFRFGSFIQF